MTTIKDTLVVLGMLVVAGATGWASKGHFDPTVVNNTITDTTYVDRPYEVEKIKEVEKPVRYTEYITRRDTISSIEVVRDTVYVTVPDGTVSRYDTKFLTNYTDAPKFLGLTRSSATIEFTGLTPQGKTITKEYPINTNRYSFGLDGKGFVAIRTEPPDRQFFTHSTGAGWLQRFGGGYPYVKYSPSFNFGRLSITADGYLSQQPLITAGVEYELR